ncbi:hypothetical protein CDD82_4032 [Ophiocordyceps australis]|uniref:Trafficking protein particle complex subunit 13 n=1 Tax=Ophiocordyceps australis TaxID=1399860 RepID=A0A2C5Z3G6_9HYPO|nr:hypothetical protein CDD82_4032 [Ophiocordyceps australis]
MSHQRYPSHDPIKEPHAVSIKVLRLSRPLLVKQHAIESPCSNLSTPRCTAPASLAYRSDGTETNSAPFVLSPILNLPVSFGSAYVGETFSCTLCANNDLTAEVPKRIRDVRITAEMKTPGLGAAQQLDLGPRSDEGTDLEAGETLQKVLSFDLKEEGNHVLAVTVSYYEASDTSGRTRTFRKLYQFICKASLVVRTKVGVVSMSKEAGQEANSTCARKWVLEAQLENCSEEVVQLEKVAMELEPGLRCQDCNWQVSGSEKPVLHSGEVEQVCFVIEDEAKQRHDGTRDQRITFGVLGIGWRGQMGNKGFLSTGKLGTRVTG